MAELLDPIDVRILGPVEVRRQAEVLALGGPRQRGLLALLAIQPGRIVASDRLIDELWAGDPPDGAETTLRSYVSRLRAALGDGAGIRASAAGYVLDVRPDLVDATRFQGLTRQAEARLEQRQARRAAQLLRDALALWRGRPFGELADEGTLRTEADRLEELRLHAIELRIEADLELGASSNLIGELEALVHEHPYRERLWRHLMLALYRAERQADALAAYQRARHALDEELGLEPGEQLRGLEAAILRQEVPAATAAGDHHNVPAPRVTEIFGREDVLATVLEAVVGLRTPPAVLLEGAAGIGKTVVLDAVVGEARAASVLVLETRPSEAEARISLLGLHDLLAPVADEVLAALPAPLRTSLEIALGLAASDGAAENDPGRLAVAVTSGLRALAASRRVVVAIDDIQWLDASTAALVDTALRRLRNADLRVVATRRTPSSGGRGRELSLQRVYSDELRRIPLEPLSIGALHRVIGARLRLSLARPTLVRIHEASGGNPLYALELARLLGGDAPTRERLDASVPDDLTTLLGHRIKRLPAPVRQVLLAVALTNRPTTESLAAATELPSETIETALQAGADAGLLVADAAGIRVAHPLIGAVARVRAPIAMRRGLHSRLADIVADPTEAVVHQALAAKAPDEGVAAALEVAARDALRRGASAEAADLFHRAVRLTPTDRDGDRIRRRVGLAEAFLVTGDTERAAQELGSLQPGSIENAQTRVEAVLHLGVIQWMTGDVTEAIRLHEEAIRSVPDQEARARLHMRLAWLYERDLRRSHEHAVAALDLLDPATHPFDYAFALLNRAAVELALGERADHDAIARGAAMQDKLDRWEVSTIPVNWAMWMDDWDRARALIDRDIAMAEERADETGIGHMLGYRAEVEAWSGNLPLALEYADAAVQRAESTGQQTYVAAALARRAQVHAAAGALGRAEEDARIALGIGEEHASPTLVALALGALGSVARQRDDPREVDRLLTRASAETAATGDVGEAAHRYHSDHLDALVAIGELSRARDLADRLELRGRLGPRPVATAIAERGRASIALAEGRIEDALAHLERATEQHARAAAPYEAARTLVVAAQVNRRAGRRKAAEAQLQQAIEIFDAVGATGWAARARADLTRLGLQPGDSNVLTPSEERIARLAAAGLRNREIATQLSISPKTVEASLARAYGKLNVRSRTELARRLHERENEVAPPGP